MSAGACLDREVEIQAAARAQEDGGTVGAQARAVRGDQQVGGQQVAVLGAQFAQPHRAGFLAHLDQVLGVEAELAARLQHQPQRLHVDGVLALVVGNAAAVPAAFGLGQRPRRQAFLPFPFQTTNHIAVPVAQHRGQGRILDAFGVQERRQRLRMRQRAAGESQGLERRTDLVLQIVRQHGGAFGVLAFRGQRQSARQQRAEGAGIKAVFRLGDGVCAGHGWVAPLEVEGTGG